MSKNKHKHEHKNVVKSYGIDVEHEMNKILEEEMKITVQKIGIVKSEPMKQEDYDLLMDKYEELKPINEPYQFSETSESEGTELITGISSEPITPKYGIKGYWGTPNSNPDVIKMEIHFEHESYDDNLENVRPDYIELIKEMRKAKHRNDIMCAEIDYKYNLLMSESKKHH